MRRTVGGQGDAQRADDRLHETAHDREQIGRVTLVGLAPQLAALADVDEAYGDSEPCVDLVDLAPEHRVDAELPQSCLVQVVMPLAPRFRLDSRRDREAFHGLQRVADLAGDAGTEKGVLRRPAEPEGSTAIELAVRATPMGMRTGSSASRGSTEADSVAARRARIALTSAHVCADGSTSSSRVRRRRKALYVCTAAP